MRVQKWFYLFLLLFLMTAGGGCGGNGDDGIVPIGLKISMSPDPVFVGETRILHVKFDPANATKRDIAWTQSVDPPTVEIEKLNNTTYEVTGLAPGTTVLTAKSTANTSVSDSIEITVANPVDTLPGQGETWLMHDGSGTATTSERFSPYQLKLKDKSTVRDVTFEKTGNSTMEEIAVNLLVKSFWEAYFYTEVFAVIPIGTNPDPDLLYFRWVERSVKKTGSNTFQYSNSSNKLNVKITMLSETTAYVEATGVFWSSSHVYYGGLVDFNVDIKFYMRRK